MKVLVIGGAGFIGSHTVDALIERGHDVRVLDDYSKRTHGPKLSSEVAAQEHLNIVGDASRHDTVERALKGIEAVYHFAAYQDYLPDFSTFVRVNVESVALLYEVIVDMKLPIQKVILASSQAVYGEGDYYCRYKGRVRPPMRSEARLREGKWAIECPCGASHDDWYPTSELTAPDPHNAYGLSKLAGEQFAVNMGARYGIPTVVLRYSIVQGPRQSFYNAYSGACRIFCLAAHLGLRPTIYEDGRQVRDYVNVHDAVDANILALEQNVASKLRTKNQAAVFNVGGGKPVTVLELAETVSRVFGKPLNPEIPGKYRVGDVRHVVSDITRLKYLGWEPKRTVEDSVREYKAWLETLKPEDTLSYAAEHMAQLGVVRETKGA